jgi:hypothetical protein
MDPSLRDAWTRIVSAGDLDDHMQAVGQAQANAALVEAMVAAGPEPARRSMVFVGAGTGQMFDFVDPAFLAPYRLTFTDINPAFLARLRERLAGAALDYEAVVDDLERPALRGPFGAAVVVLVLEHVEWRRGLDGLAALRPEVLHLVVQRNPSDMASAVTPGRVLPPTIAAAAETAHPTLVDPAEVGAYLGGLGYALVARRERGVPDAKTMIGLTFAQGAAPTAAGE